jgi:deazaflavin-dependent oxidoreductase (nitroreductase family)
MAVSERKRPSGRCDCYHSSGGADGRIYKMTQPSRPEITVPSLSLTTTGRKSGERFIYRCSRGKPSMVISSSPRKAAHRNNPGWYRNILANPEVDVQVGTGKKARARTATAEERGCRKRRSNSGRPTAITSARPSARSPSSCWTPPLKSAEPALAAGPCVTAAAHCPVSGARLLNLAGEIGLYDMGCDCRTVLQIWKLPLLAISLSISGRAAFSSSLHPLG